MKEERIFEGIAASPGIVVGKVLIFGHEDLPVRPRKIKEGEIPVEIARFENSLIATRKELLEIRRQLADQLARNESDLFDAHLLVVEDRALIEEVVQGIEEQKFNAEYIFQEVLHRYEQVFSQVKDDYIRERLSDIKDVGRRVMHNLTGQQRATLSSLEEISVVVAHDLSPSDTALMHREMVVGFVTDVGGRTSHTAIMARSLAIPAVVGVGNISGVAEDGEPVVVDGNRGRVILNPSRATLARIEKEKRELAENERMLSFLRDKPAETKDGFRVTLASNIELPEDINSVIASGAEGVGLFRTEYLFLNRDDLPSEEEQFQAYSYVAEKAQPHSVIIRTLDVGGDKFVSQLDISRELNPFLGWRAVRFCLERTDIFKNQLRAILRAGRAGNVKVLFPLVSGKAELRRILQVWEEAKGEVEKDRSDPLPEIEVGIMIEVPSAAVLADNLAEAVDFFSIGTNDLIQYTLAVDRVNEKIAYLYEPLHPAVLQLIRGTIDAAHRNNIWVGMCGEMAGDPIAVPILLGMGLDEFSVSPVAVPLVKKVIRSLTIPRARDLAESILGLSQASEIRARAETFLKELDPSVRM
ncbi:MAG TPA: phosphoenolpyruvate--protein phosphotransferase [bacterium]|nr:phosphoenolpyruvate--protein phosphotransferase [bacterium]